MPEGFPIQTNFTSGEVSQLIRGRVDITRYFNGCERLENFIVRPQGGIMRRSGTRFVREVKTSSKLTILVRFEFSSIQAYMLEFGENYIRIYKNGGIVLSGGNPVEIVTTYTESELRDLYFTQSADILFICHPLHKPAKLSRSSDTAWTLTDMTFLDGPYLDQDISDTTLSLTSVVNSATLKSTASDFVVGDVGDYVEYTHNGVTALGLITAYVSATQVTITPQENVIDSFTIDSQAVITYAAASGAFPNRLRSSVLIWSSETENAFIEVNGVWRLTGANIAQHETVTPAYGNTYSADLITVTSTPTVVVTTGVLTFSNHSVTATLNATNNTFASTDVGRPVRMDFSGQQVWAKITGYTSAKLVAVSLGRMMPLDPKHPDSFLDSAKTDKWRFGAWYSNNYPSVVTFHQERLTFSATTLQPQTVWMSVAGDYFNMAPTDTESKVLDDSAITYTIASGKVNVIKWMVTGPVLLIGTIGAEWQVKASSITEALTPTNINVSEQTAFGSANVKPERIGSSTLFIQRSGQKLRELSYNFELDSFVAKDMSVLSEHILRNQISAVQSAYQQEPNSIFWMATTNGALVGMTLEKDQEVVAWHNHFIGGSYSGGIPVVESVATVPSATGANVTYIIVKRTINGATKRYVEYIEADFWPTSPQDKASMFFIDSGLSYSGAATNTVTGLSHLEGQSVTIVADGAVRPNETVSGGSITFDGKSATTIQVGLGFSSLMKSLPLEAGSESGTAQGKIKRVNKVTLRILNSLGFKVGTEENRLQEESFRSVTGAMDSSPDLFTGDRDVNIDATYELASSIFVKQDKPYPLNILAIMPQVTTNK